MSLPHVHGDRQGAVSMANLEPHPVLAPLCASHFLERLKHGRCPGPSIALAVFSTENGSRCGHGQSLSGEKYTVIEAAQ